MKLVIENAVVVGRSFGENLVYTILDELSNKTITMIGNSNSEVLDLGVEGMVTYSNINGNKILSFESVMVEELV